MQLRSASGRGIHLKSGHIRGGTLCAKNGAQDQVGKRSSSMGDIAYIIGLIVFFVLGVLYVAALERI
jgi:hypothetical protein